MMYRIIFVFCLFANSIRSQSYGCRFLPLIIEGSERQIVKYKTFLVFKDSVKIERSKKGQIKITNKSSLPLKFVDSLAQNLNYNFFFDDSIFHLNKNVLLIDTFNFFNNHCYNSNQTNFVIVNSMNDIKNSTSFTDTIKLKSIRVYQNTFVLALQHSKSLYEVHFHFRLIANLPPKLENIFRQWPLYEW